MILRPFLRYYGGKWRAAPLYPEPLCNTIVEPFAGAAGYAMRYHRRNVILVEKYPPLAEMWRWLIRASSADVMRLPCVESVDDLPDSTPTGAKVLVGFQMSVSTHHPARNLSSGLRKRVGNGWAEGWGVEMRDRVASQVDAIRHWRIIEGDYTLAPNIEATWFIDPPYNNMAGSHYPCGSKDIDYTALASWCMERQGQVMVCENVGATWLPFRPFAQLCRGLNKADGSNEVIWTQGTMDQVEMFS